MSVYEVLWYSKFGGSLNILLAHYYPCFLFKLMPEIRWRSYKEFCSQLRRSQLPCCIWYIWLILCKENMNFLPWKPAFRTSHQIVIMYYFSRPSSYLSSPLWTRGQALWWTKLPKMPPPSYFQRKHSFCSCSSMTLIHHDPFAGMQLRFICSLCWSCFLKFLGVLI